MTMPRCHDALTAAPLRLNLRGHGAGFRGRESDTSALLWSERRPEMIRVPLKPGGPAAAVARRSSVRAIVGRPRMERTRRRHATLKMFVRNASCRHSLMRVPVTVTEILANTARREIPGTVPEMTCQPGQSCQGNGNQIDWFWALPNSGQHGRGDVSPMRLNWRDLGSARADDADGMIVEIDGFAATALPAISARYFILVAEPGCCPGCLPRDRSASVEVFAASPVPARGQALRLTGVWRVRRDDPWRAGGTSWRTRVRLNHLAGGR